MLEVPDLAVGQLALPDVSAIDRDLQGINTLEQSWSLPGLPDDVKLDLISMPELQGGARDFLTGLGADLRQATMPTPRVQAQVTQLTAPPEPLVQQTVAEAPPQTGPPSGLFLPASDPVNELRRIFSGVAGGGAPERLDLNSVADFKARAVAAGLLPEGTPIDNRWSAELNGVKYDLMREDFRRRVSGDRPGAISTASVMKVVDEWLSPSGLLAAGMALDFIPDLKQAGREFSGWGDKVRKWWNNKTSPRDFIDAVTGPIDDIAFPLLNTALLFSGFSTIPHFARAASLVRGGAFADDIGRAGVQIAGHTFGKVSSLGLMDEVARMGQQGILSTRMSKSSFTAVASAGDAMASWRKATAVMVTKKTVQQGMRLGFMGQVEKLLIPDREMGFGLGGNIDGTISVRIDDFLNYRSYNPAAMPFLMVGEMALSPTSIFKPGTFVDPVKTSAQKLSERFASVTKDQQTVLEVLGAAETGLAPKKQRMVDAILSGNLASPDVPADVRKNLLEGSAARWRVPGMSRVDSPEQAAVVALLGNGNTEKAGEVATFIGFAAAVDKQATMDAIEATGAAIGTTKWQHAYHRFRNHYINRIRYIDDIDPDDVETAAGYLSVRSGVDAVDTASAQRMRQMITDADGTEWVDPAAQLRGTRQKTFNALLDEFTSPDPAVRQAALDRATAEIQFHNEMRVATLNDVFDVMEPGDIAGYMLDHNVWDSVDNWDGFLKSMDDLDNTLGFTPETVTLRGTRELLDEGALTQMGLEAHLDGYLLPANRVKSKWTNSLQKTMVEGRGRVTVAKLDTATLQQAELLDAQVSFLLDLQRGLDDIGREGVSVLQERFVPLIDDFAARAGKPVARLSENDIFQFLKELRENAPHLREVPGQVQAVSDAKLRSFARAYKAASKAGQGGDFVADLQRRIDAVANDSGLWSRFRVESGGSLKEKLKALKAQKAFLAQDVDVPPELAERLAAQGYKAVHGTDFVTPTDLLDFHGPLGAIRAKHVRQASLGQFLSRNDHRQVTVLKERRFRQQVGGMLERQVKLGRGLGRSFDLDPNSVDMDELVRLLTDTRENLLNVAMDAEEAAQDMGAISRFAQRAANSGLPQSRWMIRERQLLPRLKEMGFSDDAAKTILAATRKANQIGFQYQGLQGVESFLVGNSWVREAFKTLGMVDGAEGLSPLSALRSTQPNPVDAWRHWKRAGVGALAGAATYAATEDPRLALAGGAVGAAMPGAVLQPRMAARAGIGFGATALAQEAGMDRESASLLGVAAGVGGVRMLRQYNPARHGGLLDKLGWSEYSRVGSAVALTRDRVRFALSPIFDLQRYTEGMTLSATADLPDGVTLPVTAKPMNRLLKDMGMDATPASRRAIIDRYNKVSGGHWDLMEASQSRFREIGLLGFSPVEWEAAAWGQLVRQGLGEQEAFEMARNLYTYGVTGRSAAELSVNFVFFPFSFQKKWLGQMAKFMSKDLGRTVMVHNALKTWEILYEEFDLGERWRDHLPLADQLRKVNPLAFGINPGQLGGINRPLIDLVMDTRYAGDVARDTMNLFLPQAARIETEADLNDWNRIARRMLPVWRDAEDLIQDLAEQGHVAFSPTHRTRAAEVEAAYEEWGALKRQAQIAAREQGYTLQQIFNASPTSPFAAAKAYLDLEKQKLLEKYPGWRESLDRSVQKSVERQRDIKALVTDPQTGGEVALARFDTLVQALEQRMRSQGLSLSADSDLVEPDIQDSFRRLAIQLASEAPEFAGLYRTYFERLFGPIHRSIR
jgi:hypothetical protein